MTYSQIALSAGILPAAGDGSTNDGRDRMVALGTGQVTVGSFGNSLGDGTNSAVVFFYRHGERKVAAVKSTSNNWDASSLRRKGSGQRGRTGIW